MAATCNRVSPSCGHEQEATMRGAQQFAAHGQTTSAAHNVHLPPSGASAHQEGRSVLTRLLRRRTFLVLLLGSAPLPRRKRTVADLPPFAARLRGVAPGCIGGGAVISSANHDQPGLTGSLTAPTDNGCAQRRTGFECGFCPGEKRTSFRASKSAPFSRSMFMTAGDPAPAAARCSAVLPICAVEEVDGGAQRTSIGYEAHRKTQPSSKGPSLLL